MIQKRILIVSTVLVCTLPAGCTKEQCVPAEIIKVRIGEAVYKLPASYRPDIFGTKLSTRYVLRNGRNVQEYCQKPEDPPSKADSFGLSKASLEIIAAQHFELSHLRGVELIEVNDAPAHQSRAEKPSETFVGNGLFRRVETNGIFEFYSTQALFFGNKVSAFCGRAATQRPSNWCTIEGQIAATIPVRVKVNDRTHPIEDWPRTLEEVERLIRSFATP